MTCYKKYIANKTHEQVLDVYDKVITGELTNIEASKLLNMPIFEFEELFEEISQKVLLA